MTATLQRVTVFLCPQITQMSTDDLVVLCLEPRMDADVHG